jgi:exonuclease VII large subunit
MFKKYFVLLDHEAKTATGGNPTATPPQAAETVAAGKSEKEMLLEQENARLKKAVAATAAAKRKVEIDNAHLSDQVHQLKQIPQPKPAPAAPVKKSWGFFTE